METERVMVGGVRFGTPHGPERSLRPIPSLDMLRGWAVYQDLGVRFRSLETIATTNYVFGLPCKPGLVPCTSAPVNADSFLVWRTKCPVKALAGEVDLYMGILNLLSKEPAKAEAEQAINQAGQTVTNSSPPHTRGIYPRSEDERRFFGDFEVEADAEPIPIPTNSPRRDDMSGKVNIEGPLKPRNTLQQSLPSIDARQPMRTYERSAGSKRMRTEMIRGDNVPHTEERWNLHTEPEHQKRKKIKSRESIVISDDEMVTHKDTNNVGWPEDSSHPTINLGLEMEDNSSSAMNGDVPEFRDVEKLMKASRGGKSFSGKTNTPVYKFDSRELRKSLPKPPSQPSSPQVEEISDDEVHPSSKPEGPYKGTSFLPRKPQAVKRPDRARPRRVLQNVKSMRQTDTKSAYFLPSRDQRGTSKPHPFGRLADSSTPINSRDFFKRVGDVDDSPDILHNGDNVGVRSQQRVRDLMTTNGHPGPVRRSRSPPQDSPLSTYRSPNDIPITRFGGSKKKAETPGQATASSKNNRASQGFCFKLKKLVYGHTSLDLGDHEYRLRFDSANGEAKVAFDCRCGTSECSVNLNCLAFPVMKVVRIAWHATMVQIMLSKCGNNGSVYLLDFLEESESFQFVTDLMRVSKCGNVLGKDRDHMEKMFLYSEKLQLEGSLKQHHLRARPESRSDTELDQDANRIQHNKERQNLRRDGGRIDAQPTAKRRKSESGDCGISVQQAYASRPIEANDSKVGIFEGIRRETRSKNRSEKISQDPEGWSENQRLARKQVPEHQESKFSELKREHKPWDKPLVFPADGPKKTTVDFGDLERLDEGEFLNDNIIAFYLRYLERDLEVKHPSIAERIYFFNTFFYERLTSRSSGKKGINYEGVQKWTSRVDIFNFDYVVVPVNESAHWYVAIICNLPSVSRAHQEEKEDSLEDELGDIKSNDLVQVAQPSSPNSSRQTTVADAIDLDHGVSEAGEQVARISLTQKEMAKETGNLDSKYTAEGNFDKASGTDNIDDENWPAADENPPVEAVNGIPSIAQDVGHRGQAENVAPGEDLARVRVKAQYKPKKAKRKSSLRKYNVNDPVIITLDSLGLTHSITARNLKEYLIEEGKSKRQLRVLIEDISAMNSKEIPLQDNFCDCGIYLLSYIEKFLKDPRSFVNGILRREMDQKSDWPDLNPSVKRDHLRNLLLDLYKEQNDTRKKEAISRGKYYKGLRQVTHGSEEELSSGTVSQGPKSNQRKLELSETGHEASNAEATTSIEGYLKTRASSGLEDSLIVVGGHPGDKQPGLALGEDSVSYIEASAIAEPQDDLHNLGSVLENTSRRTRKDRTAGVDANVEPAKTESMASGKSPERYLRRASGTRDAGIARLEVVVSPRRRTRNQLPNPELNGGESIILE